MTAAPGALGALGYERVLAVKERAEARLRALPGVHAVGIGRKVAGGKPAPGLAIVVFLVEKKPLDRLAPAEVVPAQIDGVPTDVVEMAIPRLLAADPSSLVATVSADGRSVNFSSGRDKPGEGLLIVLACTSGPTGSPPGPPFYIYIETRDWMNLAKIALVFQQKINVDFPAAIQLAGDGTLGFTAEASGSRVKITPKPGNTCAITQCTVTAVDDSKVFKDYLRGGVQIEPGGPAEPGTLGCIATTLPTPDYPQGRVVALTCQHVVAQPSRQGTNLIATHQGPTITFSARGTGPILADTLVVVALSDVGAAPPNQKPVAFYGTLQGDTPEKIAIAVAKAISDLGLGLSTMRQGAAVTVTGGTPTCLTYGPPTEAPKSDLHAHVAGLTIELTGEVSDDDYGIYTNVNIGGIHPTFGTFLQPAKHRALSDIAQDIATSLNQVLPVEVRGSVTATAKDARVTVTNAQQVECIVKNDCRVGQPVNSFCSRCSPCCSDRIGRVLDARIDVDAALIQLDADRHYKPEIPGVGLQKAPLNRTPQQHVGLPADKRGRTTGRTHGFIDMVNMSGLTAGDSTAFHRSYANAMRIQGVDKPYALAGDSGAAVFLPDATILGILFSSTGNSALMTPIEQVTAAFPALGLDFAPNPAAGHAPGDVRTVPKAARSALAPEAQPAVTPFVTRRLAEMQSEIAATPAGSEVAAAVERHFAETHRLVTSNRRVAAVWRRSGGPQLVQAVLDLVQRRDRRLPEEIAGRPFAECLERIRAALARYASPDLAADLARFGPRLAAFAGLTYPEMLTALAGGASGGGE